MAVELRTGTFESTLDDKGRVGIPTKLRDRFEGELVITQGSQACVWIMTPALWEQFQEKLEASASSLTYEEYMAFKYQHEAAAQVAEIDKSGRIPVPAAIRKYAGLTRDCLVVSIEDHLEIWNAETYQAYMQEVRAKTREAMQKMGAVRLFNKD
ncbi:transcriptional regulator MraZ [Spirochaetia bacterium]|nr:transcriptional regulator MraZ [Spirochaetia bacterium]